MSDRSVADARSVVERLLPEAFEGSRRSPAMSTFLRGVTTGALVGAAIAGSALWGRYRRMRDQQPGDATPVAERARD
jgi:hypothetical protein